MVTKEEALLYVKSLAEQKIITKEELDAAYNSGGGVLKPIVTTSKKHGIAEVLYYIGGAVVFFGICILIQQNWSSLGFVTKLLATLGASIAAYVIALLLSRSEKTGTVSDAFYLIFALVAPVGLWVVFNQAGYDVEDPGVQALISGIMLGTFLLSFAVLRKNVFVLFSILYGTVFFYTITNFLMDYRRSSEEWRFYMYRTLGVGVAYALLGRAFAGGPRAALQGFLYFFSALGFLGAFFYLSVDNSHNIIFSELTFPFFVFAFLLLSVYFKSKSFLVWGAIFLTIYIFWVTGEHFSESLGWPLSLVIAGLAMIGIGYMALSLKRRYLSA